MQRARTMQSFWCIGLHRHSYLRHLTFLGGAFDLMCAQCSCLETSTAHVCGQRVCHFGRG